MGSGNIELTGSIVVGKSCGGCDNDASAKVQALSLSCAQVYGGAVVSSDVPFGVTAPTSFVDLPILEQLSSVEFLYMKTNSPLAVRVGAEPAELLGSGATFPTGFVGAETFTAQLDAFAAFTATFTSGDQSAAQVAARINAAAILAGYTFQPASVDTSGQLKLRGVATGAEGSIAVTGGTAKSALGFGSDDEAVGSGEDLQIWGSLTVEFNKTLAPERIQVKGTASQVTLVAAGPSATG